MEQGEPPNDAALAEWEMLDATEDDANAEVIGCSCWPHNECWLHATYCLIAQLERQLQMCWVLALSSSP